MKRVFFATTSINNVNLESFNALWLTHVKNTTPISSSLSQASSQSIPFGLPSG